MSDIQPVTQSTTRARQSKFTPERIQQIINLVERGRSRDEIAELVGVTTATLQVMCSRLGISLRRRLLDVATGKVERRPSRSSVGVRSAPSHELDVAVKSPGSGEELVPTAKAQSPESENSQSPRSYTMSKTDDAAGVLAICMNYKGQERMIELSLGAEMLKKFVFEAEFRDMRITELLVRTISQVAEKDLFALVLEDQPPISHERLRLVSVPQPCG
jgi:hypothetical protein